MTAMFLVSFVFGATLAQSWLPQDTLRPTAEPLDRFTSRLLPEATVCRYCLCDQHTLTVTCASAHLRLKTLVLPHWAEIFHAYNVSAPEFPHFTYHPSLKVVRINNCYLKHMHPLSFIPLPNLETVHLADNEIEHVPETLFRRLVHLRIVNLARNKISVLEDLEWSLPDDLILEQLNLDGNPIKVGKAAKTHHPWPRARQLFMGSAKVMHLNATHMVFEESSLCMLMECRVLPLGPEFWQVLTSLDLSDNPRLQLHSSAFAALSNLSSLRLASVHLPADFLSWVDSAATHIRHLDISDSRIDVEIRKWSFCAPSLEWLDISGVGIGTLEIPPRCSSLQWLYAERNNMAAAEIHSHQLIGVHLRGNRIQKWPLPTGTDQLPFSRLNFLSLADNLIDKVPEHALNPLRQLEVLDLSGNRITSLSHTVMPTLDLHLRTLNLSGNYLQEFDPPILPSLAELDLSANNLIGLRDEFWLSVPSLQRLHLASNPQGMKIDWQAPGAKRASQLIELDLSHNNLRFLPKFQELRHLRSLKLDGNKIVYMDGSRLPGCLLSLSLRSNMIHYLGNFSEDQFACLKELDLGRNPLSCDCSLAILSPILKHQSGYTDRSEYYCFANGWQHPLKAYVENAEFCDETEDNSQITALVFNFLGILVLFLVLAGIAVFLMLRFCSALSERLMPFAYKPVQQIDATVDL